LRASVPKVKMRLIPRDRFFWIEWVIHVDPQMMVASVGKIVTGVDDAPYCVDRNNTAAPIT
jgi:hypothetical protein